MKKGFCVLLAVGCLLIGSLFAAAETYTLDMLPSIGWAPYKVAELKGFWEQHGASVRLVQYMQPLDVFHSAVQRRLDMVPMPMATTATLRSAGVFDVMYLGTFSMAAQHKYVIIKKDLVNKSLKGQTIGTFLADYSNGFLLSSYLTTVNTELSDVRLAAMSPDELEANFTHNRLQAVLTLDRGNAFYEEADGVIALSTSDFYDPHGLAVVKEGGAAAIPSEDLKKIVRGCIDAVEWIRDPANREEYIAILKQHVFVNMPDLTDEQTLGLMKGEKFVDPQTLLEHNQQLLRGYFAEYRDFLAAEGSVNADVLNEFTYDNVIYNQALIEVLQEYVQ